MTLSVRELTPRGRGAVSVLQVVGDGALDAVQACAGGTRVRAGAPTLLRLRGSGECLDEAIVVAAGPREVELHLHGSPPLVQRVIDHLGVRLQEGTAQASIGRRAEELLARAPCESAARILLDQAGGALAAELRRLAAGDERRRSRTIDSLLERWRVARRALDPAVVVLGGPVNSGKSTLFNALLGESRAIVDAGPGTTRDVLRERGMLGTWPAWIVDTAGGRAAGVPAASIGPVEAEGERRGRSARASADLVLWLEPLASSHPSSAGPPPGAGPRALLLRTFADRLPRTERPRDSISALEDPDRARTLVAERFRAALGLPADAWRPGSAVPFSEDLAASIEALRTLAPAEIAPAVERLIEEGPAAP